MMTLPHHRIRADLSTILGRRHGSALLVPLLLVNAGCGRQAPSAQAGNAGSNARATGERSRTHSRPAGRRAGSPPRARIAPVTRPALTIRVTPAGYRLDGAPLGAVEALGRLRALSAEQRARGVMLEILPGATKSRVVALFELLQQAGIRRFGARRLPAAASSGAATPRARAEPARPGAEPPRARTAVMQP